MSFVLRFFLFIIGVWSLIVVAAAEQKETKTTIKRDAAAEKALDASEQQDALFQGMGGMNPYGQFGGNMGGMYGMPGAFGGNMDNSVNFDFNCRCKAKSNLPANLQVPTDANAAAQQQITQLQEQIRRLTEQVRRTQQGQSTFEQFAHVLSMADGLDCNCQGSSTPFNGFPFSNSGSSNGAFGGNSQMPFMQSGRGGMMGAPMMTAARIFPPPPMFP